MTQQRGDTRRHLLPAGFPEGAAVRGGFRDFRIDGPPQHGVAWLVNLFGIESPGLNACLAIVDEVAERLG
jgi:hypothetical protein